LSRQFMHITTILF